MIKHGRKTPAGYSLIEVVVALAIFLFIVVGAAVLIFRSVETTGKAKDVSEAEVIASETFEAVKSIGYDTWVDLVNGTYGLDDTSGSWALAGTPDMIDSKYTRTITVASVFRDENCVIVTSGGSDDPDTKDVTVEIDWTDSGVAKSISHQQNFTSWWSPIMCTPFEVFQYALLGNSAINFTNSTNSISGNVNTGGGFTQGNMTVDGDVTEYTERNVPTVNYAGYEADADFTFYTSYTFTENGTYNGIYYVDGSVTIESGVTINGSIIATGGVSFGGSSNIAITSVSPYPAVIGGGNININNTDTVDITGVLFSDGNITLSNGTDITIFGAVIAGGNAACQNSINVIIIYDEGIGQNPPPYFE